MSSAGAGAGAASAALDVGAIPLVTVPDDTESAVGAKFTVNPDAIAYLQSIQTKVRRGARGCAPAVCVRGRAGALGAVARVALGGFCCGVRSLAPRSCAVCMSCAGSGVVETLLCSSVGVALRLPAEAVHLRTACRSLRQWTMLQHVVCTAGAWRLRTSARLRSHARCAPWVALGWALLCPSLLGPTHVACGRPPPPFRRRRVRAGPTGTIRLCVWGGGIRGSLSSRLWARRVLARASFGVPCPVFTAPLRRCGGSPQVAVVSIAGLYRTGKSYILNKIIGREGGFTVGPTVKACTKGIWIWGKVWATTPPCQLHPPHPATPPRPVPHHPAVRAPSVRCVLRFSLCRCWATVGSEPGCA
jgi:hypothetical protein